MIHNQLKFENTVHTNKIRFQMKDTTWYGKWTNRWWSKNVKEIMTLLSSSIDLHWPTKIVKKKSLQNCIFSLKWRHHQHGLKDQLNTEWYKYNNYSLNHRLDITTIITKSYLGINITIKCSISTYNFQI